MKTKILFFLSMLWLLGNTQLAAQHKMVKLSNFDKAYYRVNGNNASNTWAYTNVWGDVICGREFAFIGVSGWDWQDPNNRGVSIIEVTDPLNIKEVAFVSCPSSDQRDFVTYTDPVTESTYLYIIGEGNSNGMIIVDITHIIDVTPSFTVLHTNYYTGSYNSNDASHAHNIQMDEATGKMIVCGPHGSNPAPTFTMFMFDVASSPTAPILIDGHFTGTDNAYFVHDVYINNDRLYTASVNQTPPYVGSIGIYDTPTNFNYIGGLDPYPSDQSPAIPLTSLQHVIHTVYASADHTKLVTSDEHVLGQAIFWDVSNPSSPLETDRYGGHTTGPDSWDTVAQHNHVIKGNDHCFVAHYSNGLWVLDISDPYNVQEVAYYDTYLEHNYGNYDTYAHQFKPPYGTGYFGAWGVFADLPSGNILVCDMNNGLYVLNNCVPEANQSGANLTLGAATYTNQVFGRATTTSITVNPGGGNFTVGADGNVTLIAGSKISIKPGFHAQADGKFHAQIGSMCQDCPECPGFAPPGDDEEDRKPETPPDNIAQLNKLTCYPNPATNQLNLKIEIAVSGITTVAIYDQLGRNVIPVFENKLTDSGILQRSIDISALPQGIYTVKLKTATGTKTTRFSKL